MVLSTETLLGITINHVKYICNHLKRDWVASHFLSFEAFVTSFLYQKEKKFYLKPSLDLINYISALLCLILQLFFLEYFSGDKAYLRLIECVAL